jgi:predicted transcriptional regulator
MYNDPRELMTAKEICEMFGCSEISLQKNFNRTAASIKKKYNVDIIKCDKSGERYYQIFETAPRAITIYNETEDIWISQEMLSYEAYEFFTLLAIAASPFGVYRGKREDLLKYIGIKVNKKNLDTLEEVIKVLVDKEKIGFVEDDGFVILYLSGKLENACPVKIQILKESQRIADENHKSFSKIPQLIKVWQAIIECEKNQPFTYADLANLTGLSYKQIRDVKRLLEQNDIFLTSRAGSYFQCLGMNVDFNAFFEKSDENTKK